MLFLKVQKQKVKTDMIIFRSYVFYKMSSNKYQPRFLEACN